MRMLKRKSYYERRGYKFRRWFLHETHVGNWYYTHVLDHLLGWTLLLIGGVSLVLTVFVPLHEVGPNQAAAVATLQTVTVESSQDGNVVVHLKNGNTVQADVEKGREYGKTVSVYKNTGNGKWLVGSDPNGWNDNLFLFVVICGFLGVIFTFLGAIFTLDP